jgi:PAS domain S-box-containing protein
VSRSDEGFFGGRFAGLLSEARRWFSPLAEAHEPKWRAHGQMRVLLRYALALLSVAAAVGLTSTFLYIHLPLPFTAFALTAIAVTFWYGGTLPGILATVLAAIARFSLFEPEIRFFSRALYDLAFPLFALLMIKITRTREELEVRVFARTAELARAVEDLKSEVAERRRAEEHLRLVVDTVPIIVWRKSSEGSADFLNQYFQKYTGFSLEQGLGWGWMNAVHPDDRLMEEWQANLGAGKPFEKEVRLRRADGQYRWFLLRAVPWRSQDGNVVTWYGLSCDIEEQKRAEIQSRALVDAIPQQIWSGPPDGTVDYCNLRWRSYVGLGLEELQGDGWQSMLHPDDRNRVLQAWRESVLAGTPYEQEERHRGVDGTYRWFLTRAIPQRDAAGRIVRWYGTNTDIQDRKRAEDDLRHLSALLLRSQDEERRRIARELHDATGQNLVALATMIGQLEASSPSIDRRQDALLIECKYLVDLCIRELRTLSYLLHPPMLDQAGLEDAVQDYAEGFTDRSGIRVAVEIPPRLGRMPRDIELALFRVMQESLANIQRHSGSQQARIRILRDSNLVLEISDRGHGMPASRRNGQNARRFEIGVGLPSMQERVKLIGGRLDIDSGVGGTTVRVTIPLGAERK